MLLCYKILPVLLRGPLFGQTCWTCLNPPLWVCKIVTWHCCVPLGFLHHAFTGEMHHVFPLKRSMQRVKALQRIQFQAVMVFSSAVKTESLAGTAASIMWKTNDINRLASSIHNCQLLMTMTDRQTCVWVQLNMHWFSCTQLKSNTHTLSHYHIPHDIWR